jgi:glycosyltransferase involved in cell wall biosynthesis
LGPCVVNEAMSMGLPIITTTAVGAAYDLVIDGFNGFIVSPGNDADLCKAMERIINLDYVNMGRNSRLLFEKKNDFNRMAKGFSSAIQHVSGR